MAYDYPIWYFQTRNEWTKKKSVVICYLKLMYNASISMPPSHNKIKTKNKKIKKTPQTGSNSKIKY